MCHWFITDINLWNPDSRGCGDVSFWYCWIVLMYASLTFDGSRRKQANPLEFCCKVGSPKKQAKQVPTSDPCRCNVFFFPYLDYYAECVFRPSDEIVPELHQLSKTEHTRSMWSPIYFDVFTSSAFQNLPRVEANLFGFLANPQSSSR